MKQALKMTQTHNQTRRPNHAIAIVVGGLAALILASAVAPEVVKLLSGPRPIFTEWRPGDRGSGYRQNLVLDARRQYFLFDRELNTALLVMPAKDFRSLSLETTDQAANIELPDGTAWVIKRQSNVLLIAYGAGELGQFTVPPGFVEQVARDIPYPEGTFDGDVRQLLAKHFSGENSKELLGLLGD